MPAKGASTSHVLGEVLAHGHPHSQVAFNLSNRLSFYLGKVLILINHCHKP
jgi:hypothetical protein